MFRYSNVDTSMATRDRQRYRTQVVGMLLQPPAEPMLARVAVYSCKPIEL